MNEEQELIENKEYTDYPNNPESLPNATAVLVLGIVSIPTCFCAGIVGLVCGIIALVLAKKAMEIYREDPNKYSRSSLGNLKAGKICAIIGTSLAGLYVLYFMVILLVVGSSGVGFPWEQFNQ